MKWDSAIRLGHSVVDRISYAFGDGNWTHFDCGELNDCLEVCTRGRLLDIRLLLAIEAIINRAKCTDYHDEADKKALDETKAKAAEIRKRFPSAVKGSRWE